MGASNYVDLAELRRKRQEGYAAGTSNYAAGTSVEGSWEPPRWRSEERGDTTRPPLLTLLDPVEGAVLLLGGAAPMIARVLRARGMLGGYDMEAVEAEFAEPRSTLWPEFIPSELRGWPTVGVVKLATLLPIDLLRIRCGAISRGGALDKWFLWQAAVVDDRGCGLLASMTEPELRRALASPFLRRLRGDADPRLTVPEPERHALPARAIGRLPD